MEESEVTPDKAGFEPLAAAEKWWLRIGVAMLIVFGAVASYDALSNAQHNSSGHTTIEMDKLSSTPPFDKPGTYKNPDGSYDAVVIAYAFGWLPSDDLEVPAGVPVHFKIASADVVHGFQIPGRSNVNLEVIPGHVSEVTQTFDKPGRYLILCHEYCGSGHHFMTTHIRVTSEENSEKDQA